MGITIDSSDNIYLTDMHRVLKFTSTGEMSVVAGSGEKGFVNGIGEAARFSTPWALTIGSDGNLYVAESVNNCIRKIDLATTEVTTYAGICETSGSTDGLAANATFENIHAIAAAANNVFYVTDGPQGQRLRKIYTI
ncbi:NHL repeat-containing protein [Phytophthora cinnamomi]|nr:NHL repeat-containing protein [Phytophthora cinnamomi]